MTDVDEEELEEEQDPRVRSEHYLFWKNPKASKPFLLKIRPN